MPWYISILTIVEIFFFGLPKYSIHRLQKMQNTTARIFRFIHIMPCLKFLHWIQVGLLYRINFKICCLIHRAISLGEPYYLRSLLSSSLNSHSISSSSFNPLFFCFKKVFIDFRSFFYTTPFLRNHLPYAIRSPPTYMSFRKKLKNLFL